ncbi:MAG: hypothetical protein A2X59_12980 [Nitrospirae bacterium GWC2_42_7]|nr:MAG: hypothetical protein A2X59_12980 [Nitrospirae bacterium GWC2_42_7]
MELRHLRYFVAVAEELHFTKAAVRLHIAQPPLSQQIHNLEEELGIKLFERVKRTTRLTDAGICFFKEAKQILLHVEQASETARRVDRGETGRLAVGFVGSVVHTFLPKTFRLFRERFPHVELVLYELNSNEQAKAILDKRFDIGFLYPHFHDDRLQLQTIVRAPFVVAMPNKHILSSLKKIDIKELAQEPFIVLTRSSEPVIRDTFISMCHSAGFSPKIAQEASQIQTVLGIVASGLGICLVPDHIKNIKRPGVLYKPLSGSPPIVELAVAWRDDSHSPLIESFVRVTTEVIKQ